MSTKPTCLCYCSAFRKGYIGQAKVKCKPTKRLIGSKLHGGEIKGPSSERIPEEKKVEQI